MSDSSSGAGAAPQIHDLPEQAYAGLRRQVTDGIPAAVDGAFPELFAWLGEHDVQPTGPPLMRYHELDGDGEVLELEVAVPVSGPIPDDGPVEAGALPAARYVTLLHVGPYRSDTAHDLEAARADLVDWMTRQGIEVLASHSTDRGWTPACAYDRFHVGPVDDPDHSNWETELAYLIDRA